MLRESRDAVPSPLRGGLSFSLAKSGGGGFVISTTSMPTDGPTPPPSIPPLKGEGGGSWLSGVLRLGLADGPGDAIGVLELAIGVAPELLLQRHDDIGAGGNGAAEPVLGVLGRQMQVEALRGDDGEAVFGEEIGQEQRRAVDFDMGMHDAGVVAAGRIAAMLDGAEGFLVEFDGIGDAIDIDIGDQAAGGWCVNHT